MGQTEGLCISFLVLDTISGSASSRLTSEAFRPTYETERLNASILSLRLNTTTSFYRSFLRHSIPPPKTLGENPKSPIEEHGDLDPDVVVFSEW